VIDRSNLLRVLGRREVADWALLQREETVGIASDAQVRRAENRIGWRLTVHLDTPAGRGSAHVPIESVDGTSESIVDQAIALAMASIGSVWVSRPLAAPARVEMADKVLLEREPVDIAAGILAGVKRPARTTVTARASVSREKVMVAARGGLRVEWPGTITRVEALVASGDRSLAVVREARLLADLGIDEALTSAAEDLALLATATPPAGGPCTLVLGPEALLHDGLGVWAAFVTQANAVVERQGLTRYRERAPIAPGADLAPEPLTITSDGVLDHGLRSAPVGDEGDPVRRFPLVNRGIAAGLGLTPREAALRKRDANGGVRNLVVELGTWSGAIDASTRRVIEVRRLRSLAIDPYTGDASLEIALGIDHPERTAFTGGSVRIDLIAALATARRSSARLARGAYRGPDAVLIEGAELIA
jgi:predicted Zn-dependent protease